MRVAVIGFGMYEKRMRTCAREQGEDGPVGERERTSCRCDVRNWRGEC